MLRSIRRLFEELVVTAAAGTDEASAERAYRLATATLLVEMSRADFRVSGEEHRAVEDAIRRAFDLSPHESAELLARAHAQADDATSLHEFTSLINRHLTREQKYRVVELLWQVAFADGEIDRYEEHLVRKVAELIYVPHRDFIRAKLTVQAARERG